MKAKLIGAYVVAVLAFLLTVAAGVLIVMQSANDWQFSALQWDWSINASLTLLGAVLVGIAVPFLFKALFRSVMVIARHKQGRPGSTSTAPTTAE